MQICFFHMLGSQIFHSPLRVSVAHHAIVVLSATFLRLLWVAKMTDKRRNFPDWFHYLKHELKTGIVWALVIVCSILNLVYITLLSLNTMTTSTSMIFILIAIAFGLERWNDISKHFLGILPLFTSWLLTFESKESNAEGFSLAIFTSGLIGLRWAIAQILAQKQESAQQALEDMQQLKDENNRLKLEKCLLEKEKIDLQEEKDELVVQNDSLQTDLRAKEAQVHRLETNLVTAQPAIAKEFCDWVVSRDEVQMADECLGVGGWGKVVLGTFRGCKVAVKQIHELILSPYSRRIFEREMSIASRCRHPCLLQFIGATNDDGIPLFITELLDKSLRALLEQRQLADTEISNISLDVSLALNYLHNMKPSPILHRDVSSANVLLWRQGDQWRGKVSDYGTANFVQVTMTRTPGAVIYSAPEAVSSNQTPKLDVFSFGVLLCEMCTREMPDPGRRTEQVRLMRSHSLRNLVCECLRTDPAERPDMARIIQEFGTFRGSNSCAESRVSSNSRQTASQNWPQYLRTIFGPPS